MNNYDWFLDLIKWIGDKLLELSFRGFLVIIFIILLIIAWLKIPNPWTIKIGPLRLFDEYSTTSHNQAFNVKATEIPCEFSFLSKFSSALNSTSKTLEMVNEIGELAGAVNNLNYKNSTINVPANAGVISKDFLSVYHWKKSYCRFFVDEELYQSNMLIIIGNQIIYIHGGRSGYLAYNISLKYGTFQ